MKKKLWTKDFTILTLGSVVSMLGNSISNFALSLFVLDYMNSIIYYAIYLILYYLPQIIAPILSGVLIDRLSRKQIIYLLDLFSSIIFIGMYILITNNLFSFYILVLCSLLLGITHSIYNVAYQSFLPLLVDKGNYSKAYSVSSTLETLTYVMLPAATIIYKIYGILPLLLLNSSLFFIAFIFETQINEINHCNETYSFSTKNYICDLKAGFNYLKNEKGLYRFAFYSFIASIATGASQIITVPWFKENFIHGEYIYLSVWGLMLLGRVIGGCVLYKIKIPKQHQYFILCTSYILSASFEGLYMYTSLNTMRIMCLINGLFTISSHNIKVSSIQSYVPEEIRGRYNGITTMMSTSGMLIGEILSSIFILFLPYNSTLTLFMMSSCCGTLAFIIIGKTSIKEIINYKNDTQNAHF